MFEASTFSISYCKWYMHSTRVSILDDSRSSFKSDFACTCLRQKSELALKHTSLN